MIREAESRLMSLRALAVQVLWERRGLTKAVHCGLPLAGLILQGPSMAPRPAAIASLAVLVACIVFAHVSILVNDLSDRRVDAEAGKRRWSSRLRPATGIVLAALLAAAGGLGLLPGPSTTRSLSAYGAALLLGVAYSVRPFRFKGRGLLGPAVYGLSAMMAYALLPWGQLGGEGMFPPLVSLAVLLDKWTNLKAHQVIDYASDRRSTVATYAVRVGPGRTRTNVKAAALLASVFMTAAMLPLGRILWRESPALLLAAAVPVLGCGAGIWLIKTRMGGPSLAAVLPAWYLAASFGAFRLAPVLLLAWLAWEDHVLAILLVPFIIVVGLELLSALLERPIDFVRLP